MKAGQQALFTMDPDLDFETHLPPFSDALLNSVQALAFLVWGEFDLDLHWRLSNMPDPMVLSTCCGGELVAFKAGYAMTQAKYYSWLGAVHPDHRRRGLASRLTEMQHAWLVGRAYTTVETAADKDNTAMAQVNLRHGFVPHGVRTEPQRVQILYSKSLP